MSANEFILIHTLQSIRRSKCDLVLASQPVKANADIRDQQALMRHLVTPSKCNVNINQATDDKRLDISHQGKDDVCEHADMMCSQCNQLSKIFDILEVKKLVLAVTQCKCACRNINIRLMKDGIVMTVFSNPVSNESSCGYTNYYGVYLCATKQAIYYRDLKLKIIEVKISDIENGIFDRFSNYSVSNECDSIVVTDLDASISRGLAVLWKDGRFLLPNSGVNQSYDSSASWDVIQYAEDAYYILASGKNPDVDLVLVNSRGKMVHKTSIKINESTDVLQRLKLIRSGNQRATFIAISVCQIIHVVIRKKSSISVFRERILISENSISSLLVKHEKKDSETSVFIGSMAAIYKMTFKFK